MKALLFVSLGYLLGIIHATLQDRTRFKRHVESVRKSLQALPTQPEKRQKLGRYDAVALIVALFWVVGSACAILFCLVSACGGAR